MASSVSSNVDSLHNLAYLHWVVHIVNDVKIEKKNRYFTYSAIPMPFKGVSLHAMSLKGKRGWGVCMCGRGGGECL